MSGINDGLTSVSDNGCVKTEIASRELSIEVAYNVRHLGDYATRDGKKTAGHSILRSASLHRLTDAGAAALADAGVRTVIDLRSDEELEREVTPDLTRFGIRSVHAPVFQTNASPVGLGTDTFPGYGFVYERFLDVGAPAYRTLFETVADTDDGVLFHCAAGKDRTGVGAALLLEAAGVVHDDIVADYVLTAALLRPQVEEWLPEMKSRGITEERALELMDAPADAIETALATVREKHGGADSYLRSIGISASVLSAVTSRITPA